MIQSFTSAFKELKISNCLKNKLTHIGTIPETHYTHSRFIANTGSSRAARMD